MKKSNTSLTFGYILHNMLKTVSFEYFKGIYKAANEYKINLFIEGIGGHVEKGKEHYNFYISMLNLLRKKFDGLIIWGSVLQSVFLKEEVRLCDILNEYRNIPIVNIGLPLFNYPTILTDNINGLRQILKHLIEDHNYKYIGFIGGPENHYSNIERYKTFIEVLKEYDLPLNEILISPPVNFSNEGASDAAEYFVSLIKEKKLIPRKNIEAIVASNDYFALALIDSFKSYGIRVPEDIAVTGFDNVIETKFSDPPLTTIESNLSDIGYYAVKILKEMIEEEKKFQDKIYIPARLIIRSSCGCKESIDINNVNKNIYTEEDFKLFVNKEVKQILKSKIENINIGINTKIDVKDFFEKVDYFINDITTGENRFLKEIGKIISLDELNYELILSYKKLFLLIQTILSAKCNNEILRYKIHEILFKVDSLLIQGINKVITDKTNSFFNYAGVIKNINTRIANTFDITQILKELELFLKELNIKDCFFFIFSEEANLKKGVNPIFIYKDFRRIEQLEKLLSPMEIIFSSIDDFEDNYILLFDILTFKEVPIGFILFNIKKADINYIFHIYDSLTTVIASSYYGSKMLWEIKKAEHERENFLKILANQNEELKKAIEIADKSNEAKSNFLTQISHEIKTPLSVIITLAEKIQKIDEKRSQIKYSNLIIDEVKKITELINNLLDLAKIKEGKLIIKREPFDLTVLLNSIYEIYKIAAENKGIIFELNIDKNIPSKIIGDQMRLRQIIINLISNAIKFTDKGEITLIVERYEMTDKSISLLFKVKDTGIGIPEEKLPFIFEKYAQFEASSKIYEGSGLGLTITKQLIELMNGKISVESKTGKGTTFTFILPFEIVNAKEKIKFF